MVGGPSSAEMPGNEPLRARILLVDDVPANLLALQAILEPLEQELVLAHSGDEALLHLLQGDFACILMDVQMPGLTGLETAALIHARERTRHIPLIFITALSREAAYITRGYEQGAVDYLLKPVDPDILRSKVQVFVDLYLRGEQLKRQALELVEHRRAQEELERAAELEQQLVGIVGHDIRTPLSAILATTQVQLASEQLEPAQRRAFERVARGGERIGQIVDLLLDFTRARIGGGIPVSRRPGDLNEMCRGSPTSSRPRARGACSCASSPATPSRESGTWSGWPRCSPTCWTTPSSTAPTTPPCGCPPGSRTRRTSSSR